MGSLFVLPLRPSLPMGQQDLSRIQVDIYLISWTGKSHSHKVTMASSKTPDLVDLTKENKDRSGSVEKNKKINQMRLPFKKINAEEYKINLQKSLEKAKTTNDDSKKRKISA